MSTHSKVDPSTLGWVKSEIDETLKQARLALESFADNPSDKTRLRFCTTHLHQVVGTLLMVELDGAALMAKEIEALADVLHDDQSKVSDDALDALTRGIVVLPEYLERLQVGQPDTALRYRSLLNDLRAARGAEPIAELDLFAPDLSVRPPSGTAGTANLSEADYGALARQARAGFQGALLEWLRDKSNRQALETIARSLEQLQQQASMSAIAQMFWVAGGFTEALLDNGFEPTADRKKIFARLDQQIKKLIDGADRSVLRSSSEALTKAMLFEIAHATSSGPKVTQIKQVFELESVLQGGVESPEDAADTGMPAPEVLRSVSKALAREIEAAQDILTTYFDPGHKGTVSLEPLQGLLHKMAGTLDMLGVARLKLIVDELSAVTAAIIAKRIANPDTASMPMAQALLMVESSARDIHRPAKQWALQIDHVIAQLRALQSSDGGGEMLAEGIEVAEAELTESEFRDLLNVVGKEIGVNLSKIEESLEAFAADMSDTGLLAEVPQQLAQIQGALQILGLDRVSRLVEQTAHLVRDVQSGQLAPSSGLLDSLAVCIGSIGAYMEGLRAGRRNLDGLIDTAFKELEAASGRAEETSPTADMRPPAQTSVGLAARVAEVRARLEDWLNDRSQLGLLDAIRSELDAVAPQAAALGQDKLERICSEMSNLLQLVRQEPEALSDDIVQTLRQSFDTMEVLADQEFTEDAPEPLAGADYAPEFGESGPESSLEIADVSPPPMAAAPVDDDIDEDILQIFIEDAREVSETVKRHFAAWRDNPGDKEALAELRRGYHTLKGSGRMVGAGEVAELAWAVENLLNRVRDGKLTPTPEVVEIVEQAQALVPVLVDHLAGGPRTETDVEALRLRAHALAEPSAAPKPARAGVAKLVSASAKAADTGQYLPKLDGPLIEIFTNEAQGHLNTIAQEIEKCRRAGGGCLVTAAIFRSVHTLGGNARSLGVRMMAETCGEAEKLLHELKALELPLNEQHLKLLDELHSAVSELVVAYKNGAASAGPLAKKFADLSQRFHSESARVIQGDGDELTSDVDFEDPRTSPEPVRDRPAVHAVREEPRSERPPELVPVPSRGLESAAPGAAPDDDVDPELLEIFHEEAVDILGTIDEGLTRWRTNPRDREPVQGLKRALHTLKGGARMAGVKTMGELSHNTESLLKQIEDGKLSANPELFDMLEEAHDNLVSMLGYVQKGKTAPLNQTLNAKLLRLVSGFGGAAPSATPKLTRASGADSDGLEGRGARPDAAEAPDRRDEEGDSETWPATRERRGQVRVNTDLLNNLVNFAGEVSIARSRMEQQIYGFRDNLSELSRNATRFRDQIRELEIQSESQILYRLEKQQQESGMGADFDPLEFDRFSKLQQLSRSLTESLHDLSTIQLSLGNFVGEAESVLQQQARINTELQEGLMRTRMINFSTQAPRLRHMLRQTARELGKRAELQLTGSEVEIDRTVMERMIGPFEHMIRNALDHGIESESERRRAGKPAAGRITIHTNQEGSDIIIRFSDDGGGLDIDAIRRKAIDRKLIASDANLSEDELIQYILMSGFSTASKVTHISGRGVGMDVVHNEVKQLGGSMAVETKRGAGTTFTIRLPMTLSITQALMVQVGDQLYAVPLSSVSNIIEYPVDQLNRVSVGKNPLLNYNDQVYQYVNLAPRLGVEPKGRNSRKVPILLARAGNREVAIQIDGLGGTREIVVKSVGPQLSEIKGIAGATILGDGRVILILDMAGLWMTEDAMRVEHRDEQPAEQKAPEARQRPLIMVVDDSLTVRKVTGKHLQKRGMEVIVAKDGIDATEQLRERIPDVMLVDIEMPRMDGYELTNRVRGDPKLQHIPIIMVTSRSGAKHRQRAFDLGVDVYMSKPYQEEELFDNIDTLLVRGRTPVQ